MPPEPFPKRAIAFIDGQNLFHAVRDAFGYHHPNYDVRALAHAVGEAQGWRILKTRFYTGLPEPEHDAQWHRFWSRKLGVMGRQGVFVFARPLSYRNKTVRLPDGSIHTFLAAEEKGVDVRMALDIVRMAHRREGELRLIALEQEGKRPAAPDEASYGWQSDLPTFYGTQPRVVRLRLEAFIRDAGTEQIRAWDESIPWLQWECKELVTAYDAARTYTAILEYELPREARRPDVIVLENGVVVLELKGKAVPSQADIDQVFAYARDLRSYHRECADRPVHAVLVPSRGNAPPHERDGVVVVGPPGVDRFLLECTRSPAPSPLTPEAFLQRDAYVPLPRRVRAARDLFAHQPLPRIKRARAATAPAVARITAIAREAAAGRTRHLVLLTGVPGSGKTLVGLQSEKPERPQTSPRQTAQEEHHGR